MEAHANEEMMKRAMGEDEYAELAQPPHTEVPEHPKWPLVEAALREIYDPEIPVNIYELGLIYKVDIQDAEDGSFDVFVEMTLTSPGCPVAQEMPGMVQSGLFPIEGIGAAEVEIVWDPIWDPSYMAETAKLQLNMFT